MGEYERAANGTPSEAGLGEAMHRTEPDVRFGA